MLRPLKAPKNDWDGCYIFDEMRSLQIRKSLDGRCRQGLKWTLVDALALLVSVPGSSHLAKAGGKVVLLAWGRWQTPRDKPKSRKFWLLMNDWLLVDLISPVSTSQGQKRLAPNLMTSTSGCVVQLFRIWWKPFWTTGSLPLVKY